MTSMLLPQRRPRTGIDVRAFELCALPCLVVDSQWDDGQRRHGIPSFEASGPGPRWRI